MSSTQQTLFVKEVFQYFETGGPGDPTPANGAGSCGIPATDPKYFAAVMPALRDSNPAVCGACAKVTCDACQGRSVIVQIIDTCPGCVPSTDNGSMNLSLDAMGAIVGGNNIAQNLGTLKGGAWQLITCPATLGPVQSVVTGGGGGLNTTTAAAPTSASAGNSGSSSTDSSLGPILGGVAAAAFLLIVVAFVLYLKARTARQLKEEMQSHPNNRYSMSNSGANSLRRDTSAANLSAVAAERSNSPLIADTGPAGYIPATTTAAVGPAGSNISPPLQQSVGAPAGHLPPMQFYHHGAPNVAPALQPFYQQGILSQTAQMQQQQQADYSAEWAEYFRQHPEEYEKYYGSPMPR